MFRLKHAACAVLALAMAGCTADLTSPEAPAADGPSLAMEAATAVPVPGFSFFPPLVKQPTFGGTFDPDLQPRVVVCELAGHSCGATVVTFSFGTGGSSSVRVDRNAEHYIVNWKTPRSLDPDRFYRIQVFSGATFLGSVDVDVIRNGSEKKGVDETRYVPLQAGTTLPIKFRVETGIVAEVRVSPAADTVNVGETTQFTATLIDLHGDPIAGPAVAWSSSDPALATIDAGGTATGVAPGAAVITASLGYVVGTAVLVVEQPNTPPVARPDTFEALGNVTVPVAAPGVLANDSDPDANPLAAVAGTFPTAAGGTVTIAADGSFQYLSAPGFTGTDAFSYVVTDGIAADTATVTVQAGARVWYVSNAAAAPGDGRDASPFTTLKGGEAAASPGETIFVLAGDGTRAGLDEGIVLKAGQSLIGQGVSSPYAVTLNGAPLVLLAPGTAPDVTRSDAGVSIRLATGNTLRGLRVGSVAGAAIAGSSFVSLVASEVSAAAQGGAALDLEDGNVAAAFSALSSAGSAGSGVRLVNVSGTLSAPAGALSGAAGPAVLVLGGDADVTFGSDVSSAVRSVRVEGRTGGVLTLSGDLSDTGSGILVRGNSGGTIAFTGASKALGTGAANGVTLQDNTGALVRFAGGGLVIGTGAGTGFLATGGGTVVVTGAGNTIASAGGTALRVEDTTLGAGGMAFWSISASGGANGIVLVNTGANGLSVTGSGAPGTGGTIEGMSGDGVSLSGARGISLSSMVIRGNAGSGVAGSDVTGFSLLGSRVEDNGDDAAADEAGLRFEDLHGTSVIRDSEIAGSVEDNVRIVNATGSLSLSVHATTIRDNAAGPGGQDGLRLVASGVAQVDVRVSDSHFLRNRATGLSASTQGAGRLHVEVVGGSLQGNGVGINLVHGSSGALTFLVDGIPVITGHGSSPINVNRLASAGATSTFAGTIHGNVIGIAGVASSGATSGSGIRVVSNGAAGTTTVAISGNRIREVSEFGIQAVARDGGSLLNANITGNDIALTSPLALDGIRVEAGALSTDTVAVCAAVSGNTSTAPFRGIRVRQRFTGTTFRLAGYGGSPTDIAAVAGFLASTNTVSSASADRGGAGFLGAGSCPTP